MKKTFKPHPWKNGDRKEWLSITEVAELYGRHRNTIIRWLHDGTLREFKFSTFQDFKGRWWIREPKRKSAQAS